MAAAAFRSPRCRWRYAPRIGPTGAVHEPASGAFDAAVAPGEDLQAAVDRCPPGGCVLLLPGTHAGPLALGASKEVHLFGRGVARLVHSGGSVVTSTANQATLCGLVISQEGIVRGNGDALNNIEELVENVAAAGAPHAGIAVEAGVLRMQGCDVASASGACITVGGAGDPVIINCK